MTPRIPDGQLLEAALEVITSRGYARATTREIAQSAGVNEVTLFRRFGSKKQLLKAAIAHEAVSLESDNLHYSGDLETDLRKIVVFYRDLMSGRGQLITMLLTELHHHPDLLEVMQEPLAIVAQIQEILAQYQAAGELHEEPPMQAYSALVAPLFMRGLLATIAGDILPASFDPIEHVERFLGGRRPTSS